MTKQEPVCIEWHDAARNVEWMGLPELKQFADVPIQSFTFGILLVETKDRYILASTINDQAVACAPWSIPKKIVRRVYRWGQALPELPEIH